MARTPGAYQLGKGILDGLAALEGQIDVTENGKIAGTARNQMLVRGVLLDAFRSAGFIGGFLVLAVLLPAQEEAVTS